MVAPILSLSAHDPRFERHSLTGHAQLVTLSAEGLLPCGKMLQAEYTMDRHSIAAQVFQVDDIRTLEDVARLFGFGLCLSASLHWHGGAFLTLESAEG